MKLPSPQKEIYGKERLTALQAQRLVQEIVFGPVVFQVSRMMLKFGILEALNQNKEGLTMNQIVEKTKLSKYAVQVLLESSLTIGTILVNNSIFTISKAGWYLLNDEMVKINLNFNNDVNYLGMYNLEEALLNGKPEGLKVFGEWNTIYEGLSQLPEKVKKSWFDFDHFYSDKSFKQALDIVFATSPKTILDVGGNTGRWATECVKHSDTVEVTVMDLPQQLDMMKEKIKDLKGADRIFEYPVNLLDRKSQFPKNFDVIWMSQFLDCFSEEEVTDILTKAATSMNQSSRLFIMETFWDRQNFETASFCLAQISLYFTTMANGNSKMYHSEDMTKCVNNAGLEIEKIYNELGLGHSIMQCKLR